MGPSCWMLSVCARVVENFLAPRQTMWPSTDHRILWYVNQARAGGVLVHQMLISPQVETGHVFQLCPFSFSHPLLPHQSDTFSHGCSNQPPRGAQAHRHVPATRCRGSGAGSHHFLLWYVATKTSAETAPQENSSNRDRFVLSALNSYLLCHEARCTQSKPEHQGDG